MTVRFWHPPRTGGTSLREAWRPTRHELRGHREPPAVKPDGEWWYSCTRNPWDRTVSLWCLSHPTASDRVREPFADWLRSGMGCADDPKWNRLCAPTMRWCANADFVVQFESRDVDLARLARMLGRPIPTAHAARSNDRGPYQDYYDDELTEIVAHRYAADVEAFGYQFEEAPCRTT